MSGDCYCSVALPHGVVGCSVTSGQSFIVNFKFGHLGFSCQSVFEGFLNFKANQCHMLTLGISWPSSFCTF